VREHGLDRGAQVRLGRHVADGVVDEDSVEGAAEPHGAHVTLPVFALRVDRLADREHLRREIDERRVEPLLVVRRHVAAA
jgi:hypothetical protein